VNEQRPIARVFLDRRCRAVRVDQATCPGEPRASSSSAPAVGSGEYGPAAPGTRAEPWSPNESMPPELAGFWASPTCPETLIFRTRRAESERSENRRPPRPGWDAHLQSVPVFGRGCRSARSTRDDRGVPQTHESGADCRRLLRSLDILVAGVAHGRLTITSPAVKGKAWRINLIRNRRAVILVTGVCRERARLEAVSFTGSVRPLLATKGLDPTLFGSTVLSAMRLR